MDRGGDKPQVTRLLRNSFFLVITRIIDFGSVIFTTPIIARYLGLKGFGDYALIMAITIFIKPLAEFGSEGIICRDVANNKENAPVYINATSALRAIICVIIIALTLIAAHFLFEDERLKAALLIAAISESLVAFSTIFFSVIRAYEKMEYEFVCNFIHKIIFVGSIIVVVLMDMGFVQLFVARFLSSFAFLALSLYFVFRRLVKFRWALDWNVARFILKEALPLAIFTILTTFSSRIDIFVLKYFKDSAHVALFEASNRIVTQLQFIPLAITVSLFPFFSRISAEQERFKVYYEKSVKFFYIVSILPMMLMVLNAGTIITLLFGEKFIQAGNSFKILSLTFVFLALIPFMHNMLIIYGRQKMILISVIICFVSNFLLDILLVPSFGYIGASIATFSASFIFFAFSAWFVSMHLGRIKLGDILIKPTLSIIVAGAVCYFIVSNNIYSMLLSSIAGTAVYLISMLVLKTFDADELAIAKDIFLKRKRRQAVR
ncbi:MAG: flippase [Deltaproteobacteria bacterium]|nr:flippase [Deltaproteobacteria bacterium]